MTSPSYHRFATEGPRSQLPQCLRYAPTKPRHPSFDGTQHNPRRCQSAVVVAPDDLLSTTAARNRLYCVGRLYRCEQLEGNTCWRYDCDSLEIRHNKPVRCAECLKKKGKL